jgi:O-antigen/teichoic acid export membrane protein
MNNVPHLTTDEALSATPPAADEAQKGNGWLQSMLAEIPAVPKLAPVAYSLTDQGLAVGAMFLVNVVLARTQTKEEYGMFALSYSVFTFLSGLHNATILEPYTVYGSGRYQDRFSEYLRLIVRSHAFLGLLFSGVLLSVYLLLTWVAPRFPAQALLGLGLTVGFLLSGLLLRRVFYLQRQPALAAQSSFVFFVAVASGLWLTAKLHALDSFTVFLVLALGWVIAGASFGRRLAFGKPQQRFLELEPNYWREHWKYSRWVLATALVFQLMTQGYYWIVAGLLSVKEVGELRAIYNLIAPVDQVFIALSYLVVPVLAAHYASKRMAGFLSLWRRYSLATLGLTALFALAVRFLGKAVMHMLYAGKFDWLAPLLYLLALLPLMMAIGNTISHALNSSEKPYFVFWAYLSSGVVTFLGGIPLVVHFGLLGEVLGMLLSTTIYTMTLAVGFSQITRNQTQGVPGASSLLVVSAAPGEVSIRVPWLDAHSEDQPPHPAEGQ